MAFPFQAGLGPAIQNTRANGGPSKTWNPAAFSAGGMTLYSNFVHRGGKLWYQVRTSSGQIISQRPVRSGP